MIPWLKVFSHRPYKEFSDCDKETKEALLKALDLIERQMILYYSPHKINIASFGNYLPRVHWHVMARFQEDSHFPEPMWGAKQREGSLQLPQFEPFAKQLIEILKRNFYE